MTPRPAPLLVPLCLAACVGTPQETHTQQDEVSGRKARLFSSMTHADPRTQPSRAAPGTARSVRIHRGALQKSTIQIQLPEGDTITAKQQRLVEHEDKSITWVGQVFGEPTSSVIFTFHRGIVQGSINTGTESYELMAKSKGEQLFYRVAPTADDHKDDDTIAIGEVASDSADSLIGQAAALETSVLIDLMVVYTPSVRASLGQSMTEAKILSAVEGTNQVLTNSNLGHVQFRLVHMGETLDDGADTMSESLTAIRRIDDGIMDEVHEWRAAYGADLVTLMTHNGGCGLGYLGLLPASFGFSVLSRGCFTYGSLAHELGHNLGNSHARTDPYNYAGEFEYSFGYERCEGDTEDFGTIMSYACRTEVPFYSSPELNYLGHPAGVDYEQDPARSADAVRTIRQTAPVVAEYLAPQVLVPPPSSPANLEAHATSKEAVSLQWIDTSNDEDRFNIERSHDGTLWKTIAVLLANTTDFEDTLVSHSQTYFYRVSAINAGGTSAYSNVAQVSTPASSSAPKAPTDLTISIWSPTAFRARWSDESSDENGFRIELSREGDTTPTSVNTGMNWTSYAASDLEPGSRYTIRVSAFNSFGQSLYVQASVTMPTYTVPPEAPRIARLSVISDRQLNVVLTDNALNETGFELERSADEVSWVVVHQQSARSEARYSWLYEDTNLNPGTLYHYRARAYNDAGFSPYTPVSSAQTEGQANDTEAPTTPTGLVAKELTDTRVIIEWNAATDNVLVAAYLVYRDGNYLRQTTDTTYTDIDLTPQTRYSYSIKARDTSGNDSPASALLTVTTLGPDATSPAAPSNVVATPISMSEIRLTWEDHAKNEQGYTVERRTGASTDWVQLAGVGADTTTFVDRGLTSGTTYQYRVSAYNDAGASEAVTSTPVTTPSPAGLQLSVSGYKVRGAHHAQLRWEGATSSTVDIYRDGQRTRTLANMGSYDEFIGSKGKANYIYKLCESGSDVCSKNVSIRF